MGKYVIGMTAKDRDPRPNYIGETLESLKTSGVFDSDLLDGVHIFDSGSPSIDYIPTEYPVEIHTPKEWLIEHCKKIYNKPHWNCITLYLNMFQMANALADVDSKFVIMIEDDVIFCKDFLESVDKWVSDNFRPNKHKMVPVVSFFTPRISVKKEFKRKNRFWQYPSKNFYARQCVMVKREHCNDIARWFFHEMPLKQGGHDLLFGRWMGSRFPKRPCLYASCPCFAQHIGLHSSFQDKNKQVVKPKSFCFKGENWSYMGEKY